MSIAADRTAWSAATPATVGAGSSLVYALFILVNATLFIRPAEIVPDLLGLPIYNILISMGLVVGIVPVLDQLKSHNLRENPISVGVIGVLFAVVLSLLWHGETWMARVEGFEFFKIVLYYLLLLASVNSPARLRSFLAWLVGFTVVLSGLALLQYHGFAEIPGLEAFERGEFDANGDFYLLKQLRSTGIFNDPNDLCQILVVAAMIALYRVLEHRAGLSRLLWLAPLVLFVYSLVLTKSRGGFLAMIAGVLALFVARYGWRKAISLAVIALPALFLLSGGRQTKIDVGEGTAQDRIQIWSAGLTLFRRSPVFGIGVGGFFDEVGIIAHNSYVHVYAEQGFIGGTFFLGNYVVALWSLLRLKRAGIEVQDPRMQDLHPFLVALVAGYATGIMAITRWNIVPTYLVPGLAAVFLRVTPISPSSAKLRLDRRLIVRVMLSSVAFLIFIYLFVRVFARWGGG